MSLIKSKSVKRFSIGPTNSFILNQNLDNNRSFFNLWNLKKNLLRMKTFISDSEDKVDNAISKYEDYKLKKIKQNSKKFSDIIGEMISSSYRLKKSNNLDDKSKKIRIINNKLIKLNKIKKINKNINKIEFDTFREDYNKLREEMYKCEDEYYRVSTINNEYKLSFLKENLKNKTIKKYLNLKDSNFGLPC